MYHPSDEQVEAAAQRFYETYCNHSDWKNYQGLPCPRWDEGSTKGDPAKSLTEAVRSHWRSVAHDAFARGFRLPLPGRPAISTSGDAG